VNAEGGRQDGGISHPGAPHGFVADYRPSYRKEAAEDAWNQMIAWFKKYNILS
jgi:carboxymethylenebutenolidase